MTSKVDTKTKQNLAWELSENYEHMIRMQGAKISKIMLACRRRVHLLESIIFKTILEQIRPNHKMNAENNTRMIEKTI